ncbi:MAG TPA: L-threonylcarbamoyladenylate synthase [Stellaceae bacterium]|nr:L-threonylcarbamoyladenylate synthase [Stellaceae bacterium]
MTRPIPQPGTSVTRVFPPEAIAEAAALLRAGELVAFPTETVYGLGGDATNDHAVAAIFAAKDRPRFNPLIVHVPDLETARSLVALDGRAERIARHFWPGPLSLVLPRHRGCRVSLLASAGLATLALRVPAHPLALQLLRAAARPLAAPSANRSGRVSPTCAEHVMAELDGRIAAVLDGGPCRVGIESTVLDLSEEQPVLLRPGGVPREKLQALLGSIADPESGGERRSPGMLQSHYAPQRPLRLDAHEARPGEALLAFGPDPPKGFAEVRSLSETGDLVEAAARLFASLRALDRPEITAIAVMPIPESGLGAAINDRLRRAAAPR